MDDEILQLQDVIADLRRQNAALRGMLLEAIDLAGLAIRLDAAEDERAGAIRMATAWRNLSREPPKSGSRLVLAKAHHPGQIAARGGLGAGCAVNLPPSPAYGISAPSCAGPASTGP